MGDGNSSKGFDKEVANLMVGARNAAALTTVNNGYDLMLAARKARPGYVSPEERARLAAQARADQTFNVRKAVVRPGEAWTPTLVIKAQTRPMTPEELEAFNASKTASQGQTAPKSKSPRAPKVRSAESLEKQADAILANANKSEKQASKPSIDPRKGQIRELEKRAADLRAEAKRYAFGNPKHNIVLGELTALMAELAKLQEDYVPPKKTDKEDESVELVLHYTSGDMMTRTVTKAEAVKSIKLFLLEEAHVEFGKVIRVDYQGGSATRAEALEALPMPSRDPLIPSRKRGAICTKPDYNRGTRWQKNCKDTRVTFSGG